MGLFSKRNASDARSAAVEAETSAPEDEVDPPAEAPETVPQVSISVTTVNAAARTPEAPVSVPAAAPAPAPAPVEPDSNVDLAQALTALAEGGDERAMMHVLRQSIQGKLLLSTSLDGVSEEDKAAGRVPLGVHRDPEGAVYLLAFTSPRELEKTRTAEGPVSGVAVDAVWALRQATGDGYAGIVLNPADGKASAVVPKTLIVRLFGDGRNNDPAKQALAQPREADALQRLVAALAAHGGFVAGRAEVDEDGNRKTVGIAETRLGERRLLEVFTSPIEIAALGRGDDAYPVTAAELAAALRSDEGITGIIVNPAAPWLDVDRAQLAPLLDVR
ncbi:SseB protein N-terminal domain-containing protein [Plantibacter sp. VKM Ac-1784]|uniref:SseB protein N-terminal domain-containing protein n=1 Tax=Plantibacter elymi (nom. nud.) TaxID=199708 RepID=A0ABY1REN6_9MICO|nr:SseB family protein [Plantibacter sp. VKM Ac-1784]SMQ72410.1 SseB protein N-terminal domain-containing protein [Plantibacter sp. VKM Ac-1784]